MDTLDDIARSLGISKRAVRQRIDALNGVLDEHMHRGRRNRLIFSGQAVALLHRLEELHHTQRISIRQAAARLRDELEDEQSGERLEQDVTLEIKAEYLERVVEVLRRDRDHWREVAQIAQSALPPDRMWIAKLFPALPHDSRLN